MSKQDNILKNIHKTVLPTTLGKKNNDECYTPITDIISELSCWADLGKFSGKRIVCPCDWDVEEDVYGIEVDYSEVPVKISLLKQVTCVRTEEVVEFPGSLFESTEKISVNYSEVQPIKCNISEGELSEILKTKSTCNFVRTLIQNAASWKVKSITASGYNPNTNMGIPFQDVDYTKYDICISNPPFSLYSKFMKAVVGKIDFICVAPFLNRVTPNIGLPIMLGQAYLGFNTAIHINFTNNAAKRTVLCDWITSFPDAQLVRNKKVNSSGVSYEVYKDEYKVMTGMVMKDGTNPIKVPGCQIPEDYTGWMFSDVGIKTG